MEKTKNEKENQASGYMPLDTKSNEDFNKQHPDHDENGLLNASTSPGEKINGNDNKQTSAMKTTETKSEKNEGTKTYTCSMHPEIISDKPGKCPKCGMELIERK
ncbi:hypothetical protein CAP36_12090 [Chitinophagaceae bacterium IBVUCB2]|nr:hypothetical protein CAP36_12090 [Chitinophagaceae bacterium IBVUCB2]